MLRKRYIYNRYQIYYLSNAYDILYPRHNNLALSIFFESYMYIRISGTEIHCVYISEKNVYRQCGDDIAMTEIMTSSQNNYYNNSYSLTSYFIIDIARTNWKVESNHFFHDINDTNILNCNIYLLFSIDFQAPSSEPAFKR